MSRQQGRAAIYVWGLVGGAFSNVAIDLANGFRLLQWNVDIVCLEAPAGHTVRQVPPGVRLVELSSKRSATSFVGLRRYLTSQKPDLLVSLGWLQNPIAVLAARSSPWRGVLVLTEHAHMTYKAKEHRDSIRLRLLPHIARRLYPKADAIVTVSESVLADLRSFIPLGEKLTRVIPNAVDLDRIRRLSETRSSVAFGAKAGYRILSVGRLAQQKDQETLLRAFSIVVQRMPASLLIVGEGPERHKLERLVNELELEGSVQMPGFVANPYPLMTEADVFVLSSEEEGFGLVLVEAMALGCPLVSTACPGGPVEVTQQGNAGILVPLGQADLLADAIAGMLEDESRREMYRQRGLSRAQDFAPIRIAQDWESLHDACVGRRHREANE